MKYILLILLLTLTATILLWPNFHPEQVVLKHYYWQADVLIHAGYFFALTILIASLKLPVKPFILFFGLSLFSIALELLQHYSYKRGVSLMDAVDNLVGIGLGVIIFQFALNKNKNLKSTAKTNNE
jgi:VanZ family protein